MPQKRSKKFNHTQCKNCTSDGSEGPILIIKMKKQIINDLDHFHFTQLIKKKDLKELKNFQEMLFKAGFVKGFLKSDLAEYNNKLLIEFPFKLLENEK